MPPRNYAKATSLKLCTVAFSHIHIASTPIGILAILPHHVAEHVNHYLSGRVSEFTEGFLVHGSGDSRNKRRNSA